MTRLAVVLLSMAGCGEPGDEAAHALSDSAFAALQERGASEQAMGVDQYTSLHRFDDLPDGGRIELQRQADDSAGAAQIRSHLRDIADAFSRGDFAIPGFVHDRAEVPGTVIMREKRAAIEYRFNELPRGGEVRIRSADPQAVNAIHAFLQFQRGDHRAHGQTGH